MLLVSLLFSSAAIAQFTASGSVKDANGEPLIGATVLVKGTATGTITDIDGTFELTVPGESATLLVSYTGFSEREIEVSKASPRTDVTLADEATQLDEVVVTGLATTIKRTNLANSVEQVSARELTGITTQQTMDGALYGKFKGANISANSGAPGGGVTVKLRGITTFNGNSQPLYIVDGVYYDNSAFRLGLDFVSASQAGGSQTNQDNPTSRVADLDPEDIETIEILKGASAAAIYGSRAASGVVIITTKRGAAGRTTVTLSQSVGANMLLKSLGQRDWDATKVATHFGQAEVANFNAGTIHDYEEEIYGNTGLVLTSRVEFSGGSDKTKYFAGFTRKDEEGIVKNTGYDKNSFRLNLDQQLSKWLSASLSSNYIESDADRGYFNNDNTSTTVGISYVSTPPWAELFADENGNFPNNPYAPSNFLQTASLVTNRESVRRFVGGGLVSASLIQQDNQSLKLHLRGGVDYYNFTNKAIFPRELQFQKEGNGTDGVSIYGTAEARNNNTSAFLVHSFFTGSGLNFRTQLGVTQEKVNINFAQTIASFLVAGQTNIDQASARQTEHRRESSTDRGFFAPFAAPLWKPIS
ncbi:MAG: carboxypeptidase-like regulatory domain-containing protein, partial [Bacteroidota bacterium]